MAKVKWKWIGPDKIEVWRGNKRKHLPLDVHIQKELLKCKDWCLKDSLTCQEADKQGIFLFCKLVMIRRGRETSIWFTKSKLTKLRCNPLNS